MQFVTFFTFLSFQAPFTEEFVFRACMLPLLVPCFGCPTAVIVCPLFFGVGKFKHVITRDTCEQDQAFVNAGVTYPISKHLGFWDSKPSVNILVIWELVSILTNCNPVVPKTFLFCTRKLMFISLKLSKYCVSWKWNCYLMNYFVVFILLFRCPVAHIHHIIERLRFGSEPLSAIILTACKYKYVRNGTRRLSS